MSMNKNEELYDEIVQAMAGDTASFGQLYKHYVDEIYQFVFYRVTLHEEAQDLTEAIFIKAWLALDDNPPREIPFRLWLYRIARNTVIDYYRTQKEEVGLSEVHHLPCKEDGPEMVLVRRERVEELRDNLLQLAEDFQEVLICRFILGLSHSETAVVMDRSDQAVRSLQYRALNALRNLIMVGRATSTTKSYRNGSNGHGALNGASPSDLTASNTIPNQEGKYV